MNILLVNPNRFHDPPVIPVGLEYAAAAAELSAKHTVRVLSWQLTSSKKSPVKGVNYQRARL